MPSDHQSTDVPVEVYLWENLATDRTRRFCDVDSDALLRIRHTSTTSTSDILSDIRDPKQLLHV
ncbi:hypothetical protein ZHAS_00016773 [Anopheles sinensis]|uniref:Uncharacterized protein n=1 Tax=Anopheles sinensis TaxID=74873 RepID=A0A084WEX2_ANOSI|nr:hypothetical protein ZHAS_00016773 [Anopheles sinensis]